MLKFLKKHPPKEGEDRERLKKELFRFQKCGDHGFPSKPSALAYDPKLKLLAIGTKLGAIRIYGTPGFEVSAVHEGGVAVAGLFFIPSEGYVVSVCADNSIHFWEINNKDGGSVLEERKFPTEQQTKVEGASSFNLSTDSASLIVGTESGTVHLLDARTLTSTQVISLESLLQNVPDDVKASPGAIRAVVNSPANKDKLLVGFKQGLIILWDISTSTADAFFTASSPLESLAWLRSGQEFASAHSDGSYLVWSVTDATAPRDPPVSPYGPFPCKAINKIQWKVSRNEPLTVFSGGMPRASHGDRHTVSISQGDNHVVADLTSSIVDFITISRADEEDFSENDVDQPHALVILAEEELVVLDLEAESWPAFRLPYLNSIHSSAITCTFHVAGVPEALWQKITAAGATQNLNYSDRDWPINGGKNLSSPPASRDLLLTGHEDGTVRFWDASTSNLQLVHKLHTSPVFGVPEHVPSAEEEEWPPFRKVGTFDPYSDDPRLAVQKLAFCPFTETLVVAGSAGQVLVFRPEDKRTDPALKEVTVNLLGGHEGFVWKGHEALSSKTEDLRYSAGFQPTSLFQLEPPAACIALALQSDWQLLAVGTGQGFTLVDYGQNKEVTTRCTLHPDDLTGISEVAIARAKSLKKSLRESFRRLRRRRSEAAHREEQLKSEESKSEVAQGEAAVEATSSSPSPPAEATAASPSEEVPADSAVQQSDAAAPTAADAAPETATPSEVTAATPAEPAEATAATTLASSIEATPATTTEAPPATETTTASTPEATPVTPPAETSAAGATAAASEDTKTQEKQAEPQATENSLTSIVRSLYFADTYIVNGASSSSPSLWVGTSGGHIYVYSLTVPASEQRQEEAVQATLAKEVRLRHRAPVIGMAVIDSKNLVLPDPFEVANERAKSPDLEGQHSVIVCSEEQLKTFSLPALKPKWKKKITVADGSRLRKVNFVTFRKEGDTYSESDIACVTNTGDVRVYSVSSLRQQLSSQILTKEDVSGISSFVFTKDGQGFYLQSPSEFSRITLSASNTTALTKCELELAEGLRPKPEPKEEEAGAASATSEEATLVRQPTVEVTLASEQQSEENLGETEAAASSPDDVRMDTSVISADITIDSVKDVIAENEGTIVTSVRTITRTTTSTVTENTTASAAQEAHETVTVTNGIPESLDGVTDVLREIEHEVTTKTSEFLTTTTEKVTRSGEEVVKHLSEIKTTTAIIEDPSLLKQKLVETTVTTSTSNGDELPTEQ